MIFLIITFIIICHEWKCFKDDITTTYKIINALLIYMYFVLIGYIWINISKNTSNDVKNDILFFTILFINIIITVLFFIQKDFEATNFFCISNTVLVLYMAINNLNIYMFFLLAIQMYFTTWFIYQSNHLIIDNNIKCSRKCF